MEGWRDGGIYTDPACGERAQWGENVPLHVSLHAADFCRFRPRNGPQLWPAGLVQVCGLLVVLFGTCCGAGSCVYCRVLFGTCGLSATALLCRQTATQASFITQHVALTDDCDATGLLPTATTRVAAFCHTHTHTLHDAHTQTGPVCRTKSRLNGVNRCVLTLHTPVHASPPSLPLSSSLSLLLSTPRWFCHMRCHGGVRPPLCFYLLPVPKVKTASDGTSGATSNWCTYLGPQRCPTYWVIND